ncbi:Cathepsin B-like CP3 (Cathepsin B-like protease B3) [Durusdinium trenchii]|uniref:Cathepsin B-like CP3 (Cathepsin B-like protease B3) n=1 Tax=Durusdinium trenchii TaxID=1381693 RepID=A0ABP0HWN5_9DINO
MATKNAAADAAAAMSRRAKGKKPMKEFKKYIVYGIGIFVTIAAVYLAATDGQGGGKKKSRDSYRSKATAQVNDRYFVSDVTSYSAGNFTAAASPFFKGWSYADVSYGLDGVAVRGEGMIGFAGALQRCQDEAEGLESGAVPPAYDLRVQKPGCEAGEVYDQQNCSSSYAIAAATALSSRFCFSDPEAYAGTRLSPQQIVSCDKKSQGCNGGGIDAVWSYIKRRGLFPESCVPFAGAAAAKCESSCDPAKKLQVIDHCLLGGEKKIKREIFNRGPVVAPVLLKDDFLVYKSGVYTPTDNANQQYGANGEPIIHAVTIMGWGRSEGTPYWLVKNSWGKEWGEDGYARMTIGTGVLREESVIVGYAATPEALEEQQKKKEAEEKRREELKKERAERDARIREREAQRAAEAAEKASQEEEDLDFEDEEEVDTDSQEQQEGDDP